MYCMGIDINLVNYELNLINDNWLCEILLGLKCGGFELYQECVEGNKVCERSLLFGEYYFYLCLFWLSQMLFEQCYIVDGFSFELSKVVCLYICECVVDQLVYIDFILVQVVVKNFGIELIDDQLNIILFLDVNGLKKDLFLSLYVIFDGDVKGCVVVILFNDEVRLVDFLVIFKVLKVKGVYVKLFYF